jgi:PAS domain S-box-containing protein
MKTSPEPLDEPLRTLADQAPVPLWAARLDKCCIYVNPCWLAFTGRSFEQELGDGWVGQVHPNDRERCLATYHGAFESRQEFRVNFRLQCGDGAYRQVAALGLARVDARGTFRGYFALCLDVTEREQAQHALKHSILLGDYFALEALPGSVLVVAREGQILAANPAWVTFCEEHKAPLEATGIGANYQDVCRWVMQGSAGPLSLALRGVEAVLSGQRERFSMEYPAPSAGTQRWFDLVVYPLRGPIRGAILAQLEVTQRHWAEALARGLAKADPAEAHAALKRLS